MLVEGIKSRPHYRGISVDHYARRHLFALEGEGALALLKQVDVVGGDVLAKSEILYVARGSQVTNHGASLAALPADMFWTGPTIASSSWVISRRPAHPR